MGEGPSPKFSLGPFDSARFAALAEGLEVRIATTADTRSRGRLDADFFAHPDTDRLNAIEADPDCKRIGEVCEKVTSGYTPLHADLSEGEVGFATIENITSLVFDTAKLKLISDEDYRSGFLRSRAVVRGSVLCTIKRRICQAYPFIDEPDAPVAFNQDVALLQPKETEVSAAYLAAYLCSSLGQSFANREQTEQMNPYLSLIGLKNLPIVITDKAVQAAVERLIRAGYQAQQTAAALIAEAEATLLDALGLAGWSPPEPLTYTRSAADVFAAGRLDSEFAAPKVQALLTRLEYGGRRVLDVASVRREKFRPTPPGTFRYIEIGDLDRFGRCGSNEVDFADAPSRATWRVRSSDVLTSTVRPIRRLSAIVDPDNDGAICSSGFVVLRATDVSSELLLTYLRLPLIAGLMHMFATASMYPALSEADLLALPMPAVAASVDESVQKAVQASRRQLTKSERLLAAARRAVEIAIEDGEAAALTFIADAEAAHAATD